MADDSFIREVNEELRQEWARSLWGRYGSMLLLSAVMIVFATGAYQFYAYWQQKKAAEIGDILFASLADEQSHDYGVAIKQLQELEASDFGAYPALATLSTAALYSKQGEEDKAIATFDKVAAASKAPMLLQKLAKIRAAYILVDRGSFADIEKRVGDLDNEIDPFRWSAREALGLAAYKSGDIDKARSYFNKIVSDTASGTAVAQRAQMMLDLFEGIARRSKG